MENLGETHARCPSCTAFMELPEGISVEDLPSPFYLCRLQEMIRIRNNNPELACGSCDQRLSAVSFCYNCKCLVCVNCVEVHARIKLMKHHRLEDLKDFTSKDLPQLIQAPSFCRRDGHSQESLDNFCKDCGEQVCETCADSIHQTHNVMPIGEARKESKKRIMRAMDALQDKILSRREEIRKVDQSYKTVERRVISARQEVAKKIEELINFLRKHGDKMLAELESIYKEQQLSILRQRKQLNFQLSQMQQSHLDAKEILERDIASEILDMERPVRKRFQQLIAMKPQQVTHAQKCINVDYIPDQNAKRILQQSELGRIFVSHSDPTACTAEGEHMTEHLTGTGERIEFTILTKDSDHNPSYSENDRVTVQIQSNQGLVIPTRIEDKKDGSYVVSYTPLKTGIYEIDARVRGEPIKGSPFSVHVATRAEYLKASRINLQNITRVHEYKNAMAFCTSDHEKTQLNRPCGIAVSSLGEVAVADSWNRRVQLFNHRGTWVTQYEGSNELINPIGVDFDSEGNVVVSDSDTKSIHVIDPSGVTVRRFGIEQLESPWGVCVTPDGKIAVSDWGGGSVKEFSQQGKLLKEFGCPRSSSSYPSKPYYVIYHKDKYFVTCDSHCVQVFNNEGNFLYKIGEKGSGESQFRDPRGMAVDTKENLVVCDSGNHRLQIFTTDGRVFSFGIQGKEIGNFNKPQDVVASDDGRLFVTDYCNNRVQVLR